MITIVRLPAAITIALIITTALAIGLSLLSGKAQSSPNAALPAQESTPQPPPPATFPPSAAGNAAPTGQAGELLWSYKTEDYQPLAVTNGVLYGYGYVDLKHYLYAVNPATGELIWRFQTGGRVSAPAVANGFVYVRSEDSFVYALYEQNGEQLWRYRAVGGNISLSPLVSGGTVFVAAGSFIYALSANTGDEIWHYNADETGSQSDFQFTAQAASDGVLYAAVNHYLIALDAATGSLNWQYSGYTGGSLLVYDGVVYAMSYAVDGSTGKHLWDMDIYVNWDMDIYVNYYGPAQNGIIYGIGGQYGYAGEVVYAMDAVTGSVLWTYPWVDGRFFLPVVSKGIIYTASPYSVYALDADTSALQWRWIADENEYLHGFGMADGLVYFWSADYVYAISTIETPPPTPTPTNTPRPAPTNVPARPPTPTIAPTRAPDVTPTPRPTPMPDEPIINFHASQTEVITGEPVTLTLSVANSIRKPDMTLQLVLQLPANWSASGEGIGESCFSQCNATYKVPTGESRDFQLTAISRQPGTARIDSRMEWYFGADLDNYGAKSESLTLNVIDRDPPNINLHATQTEVTLGEPIVLNLTAANPITNPEATLQLVLKAPSGWSVSGAGFAQSCTGQCIATYPIAPGEQQSININMLPNQPGLFFVTGDLTWYFGNDRETSGNKSVSLDLNVALPASTATPIPPPAPTPTPTFAPPPATQVATPGSGGGNGGCGAPANAGGGDLAMLGLMALPLLGLVGLGARRRRGCWRHPDSAGGP